MRPLRLCLENFMSHRSTEIDCTQFRSVLIVGRHRTDPRTSMGIGKSNIFKAIEYVLFGETQVKLDKIIRYGCDRCKVTFDFEINGQVYRIVRSRIRKGGKSELRMFQQINNDWLDITQKTSTETEQELAKLVKISHVAFRSSILFAQADLHGLASVTPKERKAMLKEPLQISIYNKLEKIAKEKTSVVLKSAERTKILIDNLGQPDKDLTDLSEQKLNIKNQLIELDKQQLILQDRLQEYKNTFIKLQKFNVVNIDDLYRQLNKLQQEKKKLHDKIKEVNSLLIDNESKIEHLNQEFNKNKQILLKLEENHQTLLAKKVKTLSEIKEDLSKMTNREIEGRAYISQLQLEKTKFSRVIPDGDICEHCYQVVTREHRQICEEKRQNSLNEVLSKLEKYTSVLNAVKSKRNNYEIELNELNLYHSSLKNVVDKISVKKNDIEQNDKLLKQLSENISLRKNELKIYLDEEILLSHQEISIKNQIEEIKQNPSLKRLEEVQKSIASLENENKILIQKNSALNITLGVIEEKINTRNKDNITLNKLQDELILIEKELSMRVKVQQAFSSSGIPTMIINTILDDLQLIANDLLMKIRPGVEIIFLVAKTKADGQQEDTLDIVYRINGMEYEYEQLSGGQKVIVALCFKLALSLIIQHRIGVDIKFLMLDEVDSQFDESALESFVNVIKKWQEDFTIFVITHNKYVKDKFNRAILIEGDEVNGAVGSLVDSW